MNKKKVNLPDTVRLLNGVLNVQVQYPGYWSSGMGRSNLMQGMILLNGGMSDDAIRSTFMHEVVHMIADTFGLRQLNEDETAVNAISEGVLSFIRANPEAIAYLREGQ